MGCVLSIDLRAHYPKADDCRTMIRIERILRMYLIANWFNLADQAYEDALYDIAAFRESDAADYKLILLFNISNIRASFRIRMHRRITNFCKRGGLPVSYVVEDF